MYLKIRSEEENKWYYIFNIQSMTESLIMNPINYFLDYHTVVINDHPVPDNEVVNQVLHCKLTDGNEHVALFNTYAYLCNEEGKTVERFTIYR